MNEYLNSLPDSFIPLKAITLIQFCKDPLLSDDYAASKNESGYENEFNQKAWDEDPSRQWINAMQTPRVEALIYP